MKRIAGHIDRRARAFLADDSGAALIELTLCIAIFLAMMFAVFDFGRMGSDYVLVEKALQRGARIAAVRPNACNGQTLPDFHGRGTVPSGTPVPTYGTICRFASYVCSDPGEVSCTGDLSNTTFAEMWAEMDQVMPGDAVPADIRIRYTYDQNLGFLGGPYTPMVTVELAGEDPTAETTATNPPALRFTYIHPLGELAGLLSGTGNRLGDDNGEIPFPPMSISLPAEDLNQGTQG